MQEGGASELYRFLLINCLRLFCALTNLNTGFM